MEHTYVQINYNPDDLNDVNVTEVEAVPKCEEMECIADQSEITESICEEEMCSDETERIIPEEQEYATSEISDRQEYTEQNHDIVDGIEDEEAVVQEVPENEDIPDDNFHDAISEHMQELLERYEDTAEDIRRTLKRLESKFNDEILNSENRDSSVKTMYMELNEYKAGIVEKALKNVLYDIVELRETMLSQIRFLRDKKEENTISLDDFESYANDIGDILEKHDVTIYKGEPGNENVAIRQKIIRKVETEDETMFKKVAESLSCGYEYGNKILYPEKISIYVMKK